MMMMMMMMMIALLLKKHNADMQCNDPLTGTLQDNAHIESSLCAPSTGIIIWRTERTIVSAFNVIFDHCHQLMIET